MSTNMKSFLDNLKKNKSKRTQESLDKLDSLLEKRFNDGEKDYSIATIGRISKMNGGVGDVSIRNKTGEHFRSLINQWAIKADASLKKPPIHHSRKNQISLDIELLKKLDDPAMRAVFGQIIAEKNKLKAENHILKQRTEVIVDMRPNRIISADQVQQVEVIPSLNGILVNSEIEALRDAIDETNILNRGWMVSRLGSIKDENGRSLFKPGFVSAIQKILAEI
ncbi:gamma-mobile-trio protein GmtX [Acinetobacter venetianus]|uniref:gamma-mobile-trio protein GmtX n=1 Tax=Acinetobacter venetianus TaxID=52133 RepID=UPI0038506A51